MSDTIITAEAVARGLNAIRVGSGWLAHCPAHDDTHRSLTIGRGDTQPVVVSCKTGCSQGDVLAALKQMGLWSSAPAGHTAERRDQPQQPKWKAVVPVPDGTPPPDFNSHRFGDPSAVYEYRNTDGELVQYVVRYDPAGQRKQFHPYCYGRLLAETRWQRQQLVKPRPLYNAHLLPKRPAARVLLVEGEKCADWATMHLPDFVTVTWPGGSEGCAHADLSPIHGRNVTIWPDNDPAGLKAAAYLQAELRPHVAALTVVEIPDGKPRKWDCADATPEEARALVSTAVTSQADPQEALDAECACLNRTDLGNAERLQRRFGLDLLYCYETGNWYLWDGTRWNADNGAAITTRATTTARRICAEARHHDDPDLRTRHHRWGMTSEGAGRVNSMLALARALMPTSIESFDAQEMLLNTPAGEVDLETGEVLPHRREHLMTKSACASFDPAAVCPTWERFLRRVMGGDGELVQFLQTAVGYSLTGSTREQCLFVLYGTGRNGKSTMLNALKHVLGGYAKQADPLTFMATKYDGRGPRPDLVSLRGARFVPAIEVEEGQRFAEALVKTITGQDTVSTRDLYGKQFEFVPQFKIWIAANHKPVIRGQDMGIWRRIRLIPFTEQISEGEMDPNLPDKLVAESDGILAWAIRGALRWQEYGLQVPDAVTAATADYKAECDRLSSYLEEHTLTHHDVRVRASDLYQSYKTWCEKNGERCESMTAFGKRITERGIEKRVTNHGIYYLGLGLLAEQREAASM